MIWFNFNYCDKKLIRNTNQFFHRARIFTDFFVIRGQSATQTGAWVATLLGVQDYKKVRFPGRDISSLAVWVKKLSSF